MLANLDAGNFGADRLEFAPDLRRRVLLEIEHVLVRRSARQEDHDDRLMRFADAGLRLGAQQLRQRQTAQPQRADLQKIPARNAVTKPRFIAVDRQHNASSLFPAKTFKILHGCTVKSVHFPALLVKHGYRWILGDLGSANPGRNRPIGPLERGRLLREITGLFLVL